MSERFREIRRFCTFMPHSLTNQQGQVRCLVSQIPSLDSLLGAWLSVQLLVHHSAIITMNYIFENCFTGAYAMYMDVLEIVQDQQCQVPLVAHTNHTRMIKIDDRKRKTTSLAGRKSKRVRFSENCIYLVPSRSELFNGTKKECLWYDASSLESFRKSSRHEVEYWMKHTGIHEVSVAYDCLYQPARCV